MKSLTGFAVPFFASNPCSIIISPKFFYRIPETSFYGLSDLFPALVYIICKILAIPNCLHDRHLGEDL